MRHATLKIMRKSDDKGWASYSSLDALHPALADNYFLRLRGLIGRNAADLGGLLIVPCAQIHTYFMGEDIDVVYLDKDGNILQIDERVPPKKICKTVHGSKRVLELPAGRATHLALRPGDKIA